MPDLTNHDIGRYHVLERLGEGGMATVYKAFDTRLDRDVAIKFIRVDQFAPAVLEHMLKRFEREAKTLARLSHPNIVKFSITTFAKECLWLRHVEKLPLIFPVWLRLVRVRNTMCR